MPSIHTGCIDHTLISNAATKHRIDFLAVPCDWEPFCKSSWVDDTIETSESGRDHLPVMLKLHLSNPQGTAFIKRRKAMCSRSSMLFPENAQYFLHLMQWCPQPSWQTHGSYHHAQVMTYIQWAAAAAFPVGDHQPKKEWIDEDTWCVMRARKAADRDLQAALTTPGSIGLRGCWYAWKRYAKGCPYREVAPKLLDAPVSTLPINGPSLSYCAKLYAEWRLAAVQTKAHVKHSWASHCEQVAKRAQRAADNHDSSSLFAIVRQLGNKRSRKLPMLQLKNGNGATSIAQIAEGGPSSSPRNWVARRRTLFPWLRERYPGRERSLMTFWDHMTLISCPLCRT